MRHTLAQAAFPHAAHDFLHNTEYKVVDLLTWTLVHRHHGPERPGTAPGGEIVRNPSRDQGICRVGGKARVRIRVRIRVKKSIFPTFPRAGRCREDVREGAREDAWEDAREDAGRAAGPPGSVPAARCIKGHVPGRSRQRPRVPGGPAALRQRACGTL